MAIAKGLLSVGKASRDKGKRGERLWRDELRKAGFAARRGGQQGAGGCEDSPDVICEEMRELFHPEVKFVEAYNVRQCLTQAIEDAGEHQIPYVAQKSSRKEWVVSLRAEDFMALVKSHLGRDDEDRVETLERMLDESQPGWDEF